MFVKLITGLNVYEKKCVLNYFTTKTALATTTAIDEELQQHEHPY
jgi:hypothetical protein